MANSLAVDYTKPVKLDLPKSKRFLFIRNKATADGGKRVFFAFTPGECVADATAYLEPGEALPLLGHQHDIGSKCFFFITGGADSTTVYYA